MNRSKIRLNNVLFPLWALMLFPQVWLVTIPGNFLVDSAVLLLAARVLRVGPLGAFYKRKILPVFALGFLADIAASAAMLLGMMALPVQMGDEWFLTVPGLLLAAGLIFLFDYYGPFKDCGPHRLRLALAFAIVTAPYTFLVPSSWLYSF